MAKNSKKNNVKGLCGECGNSHGLIKGTDKKGRSSSFLAPHTRWGQKSHCSGSFDEPLAILKPGK
jgi:hypothetical protein